MQTWVVLNTENDSPSKRIQDEFLSHPAAMAAYTAPSTDAAQYDAA
jgi:hypothetical protein